MHYQSDFQISKLPSSDQKDMEKMKKSAMSSKFLLFLQVFFLIVSTKLA